MSHTPAQARELWCPMVRVGVQPSSGGPSAINDPTTVNYHGSCIAETCAMWRWVPPKTTYKPTGGNNAFVEEHIYEPVAPTHGYCGLAGRPEVA